MTAHTNPAVRHDIVLAFEAVDSNPNGDPDQGNRPRIDEETGQGLVTDVALKRKIRDTLPLVALDAGRQQGCDIFVAPGGFLNDRLEAAYVDGIPETSGKNAAPAEVQKVSHANARAKMLADYIDVRLFGAVMATGRTAGMGRARGPVQVTLARSIDPVTPVQVAIGRCVQTARGKNTSENDGTFGDKWVIPYGLYVATISISAPLAVKAGVSETDLEMLHRSLGIMFEQTASAARPNMATRALHVFSHSSALGDAPAHSLHERISWSRTGEGPARRYADYTERIDLTDLPAGIIHTRLI